MYRSEPPADPQFRFLECKQSLRKSDAVSAVADMLWRPDFDKLVVNFANVPVKHVRPAELRIIEEKKPIFNIPRQAA